jgi:alkylation response protein AidB-like acyl-CoA dehydrogenase
MDLRDRPEDVAFRLEVRRFLEENVVGEFAELGGRGGSGDETFGFEVRRRWEKVLAAAGWTCLGWPSAYGGRGASMAEQVIWNEEYARAAAPGRVNVMGEGLLGPTLIHYGTPAQKARFLPPIREGTELWCQGYSEPDAGSDLANVKTRAVRDGDEWVVTGQKVWTSLAHQADWCFVVCRTDPHAARHKGLSYLLVPMHQPGVEVRPITQLTRTSEFNEVFFEGARTPVDNVVGQPGEGWRVALATLAFERGVALLGHQLSFRRELDRIVARAESNGAADHAVVRQRLAQAHIELTIMRWNTLRSLSGVDGPVAPPSASVAKLYWASWHRRLGELAMDIEGMASTVLGGEASEDNRGYGLDELQRSFLFARSETIYGGSNQIQRNIIGERVLGLPAEPKGAVPA